MGWNVIHPLGTKGTLMCNLTDCTRALCVVLGIPIAKLYLKSGSVEIQYFLTHESGVSREEEFVLTVRHLPDDETYLALQ